MKLSISQISTAVAICLLSTTSSGVDGARNRVRGSRHRQLEEEGEDGKPMIKTQHEVSRLLLNDPKMKKKLLFQLRRLGNLDANHDKIEVNFIGNAARDQWISLGYLKQISFMEKSSTYNFFVTLSRLLAI